MDHLQQHKITRKALATTAEAADDDVEDSCLIVDVEIRWTVVVILLWGCVASHHGLILHRLSVKRRRLPHSRTAKIVRTPRGRGLVARGPLLSTTAGVASHSRLQSLH